MRVKYGHTSEKYDKKENYFHFHVSCLTVEKYSFVNRYQKCT